MHLSLPLTEWCVCVTVKEGMWRKDLSVRQFSRQFYLDDGKILANQRRRWCEGLHAAANGRMLERPAVPPTWQPYNTYEEVIMGRTQSSYDDVEFEMRKICDALSGRPGSNLQFIFMAGDGLTLMRMNHLLKHKDHIYIDQTPVVIPIQGEHPHGVFHCMHAYWRLYLRFLMWCARILKNKQVKEDPNVSDFNTHRFFFLNIVTRACAEYVVFISKTAGAPTLDDPHAFLVKAEVNANFAWVTHFLHDAGFFVLDFLQSVRANRSHRLDTLWCEFFASAHSGTANKTQYVPMAIMRVFWGQALCPALDELYHAIRTMPSGTHDGCGVGWDWACELLNAAIKAHVMARVSEEQIQAFVANWALLECVQKKFRAVYLNQSDHTEHSVDATADVNKLVAEFKKTIGATWAEVTTPDNNPTVIDGNTRQVPPWVEVRGVMARTGNDAPHAYVSRIVHDLTGFFPWV